MAFAVFFKSISAGNRPFLCRFSIFRAALKSYLTSLTPSTTIPGLGTSLANSQCTKQYIYVYICIVYYILHIILFIILYILYIYIYIEASDYGRGMT
jgi:hypothetical protein